MPNMFGFSDRTSKRRACELNATVLERLIGSVILPMLMEESYANKQNLVRTVLVSLSFYSLKDSVLILDRSVPAVEGASRCCPVVASLLAELYNSQRVNYFELVRSNSWAYLLRTQPQCRSVLLELFVQGVKRFQQTSPGEHLVETLLEAVTEDRDIAEQVRESIMLELYGEERVRAATPDHIRRLVLESPSQAVVYVKFAHKHASILQSVRAVKQEVEAERISYPELRTLLACTEHTWGYLDRLFEECPGKPFRRVIADLSQKCQEFINRLNQYENFFAKFEVVDSLVPLRTNSREFLHKFSANRYLNFKTPLLNVVSINPKILECYELKAFVESLKLRGSETVEEFCALANKAYEDLIRRVDTCLQQLSTSELSL